MYISAEKYSRKSNLSAKKKPQCLSQITLIIADKTQNNKTSTPLTTNNLSLRYNATCGIPLRYLRENKHISVLYQSAQMKPQCIPLISQIYADKTQNNKTAITTTTSLSVFLCVIMQLAAFLCVICVICGRIFTQEDSIYIAQTNPQKSPADFADNRRQTTEPQ